MNQIQLNEPNAATNRMYNHPYSPYSIQNLLMDAIYDTIENDYKIGLFESPTGTGKTLSIICATMTWLRNYKKSNLKTASNSDPESSDDEPEWVKTAYRNSVVAQTKGVAIDYENHLQVLLKLDVVAPVHALETTKRPKKPEADSFVPDDYYSDSEVNTVEEQNTRLASEIQQLMGRVGGETSELSPLESPHPVYFSSRTHSQLNQFAHQLEMTTFESSLGSVPERTKFFPLGSRKQLCIHPRVSKLGSLPSINDACVDLQKMKDGGCDYYPRPSVAAETVKQFTDFLFTRVSDIEDLATLGKTLGVCPYYSARKSVDLAEVIALPYQMLLLRTTREIMRLNIDNAIVVIDEAHNLIDTISAMNSVSVSSSEMEIAIKCLKTYLTKFSRRLNSGNRIHLVKLIKLCQVVQKFMDTAADFKTGNIINPQDIFQGNTGDLVNVHKLEKFLAKSKIAYKIESYMDAEDKADSFKRSSSNPILFKITQFLKCLTNTSKEGQFIWDKRNGLVFIDYILLDPSIVFDDIVSRAKCVLLCGGTMEPMDDFTSYLFPKVPSNKIKKFTCGHLIPKENLKVFPIGKMGNSTFEFLFEKRDRDPVISQLGVLVCSLVSVIPGGMVVFFPSYKYLNKVLESWIKSGTLDKIQIQKEIFKEPTDSLGVDSTLADYTSSIKKPQSLGAILFSVVGGKMSEGINFADDLARAVIVVGLPFPNAFSAELVAKRNFIVDSCTRKGLSKSQAMESARQFYENICMRAVNQSVGRSIRHANDYSTIFLVDTRYENPRIQGKLSKWVRERIYSESVDQVLNSTKNFFDSKLIVAQ